MTTRNPSAVFYLIVLAQFCGTAVWFAGNAVLPQLIAAYHWPEQAFAYLTSSTQVGFIAGTLIFAALGVTDRFSPSRIFLLSSIAASIFNAVMLIDLSSLMLVLCSRFAVGLSLAGIYPVGMKIAADWNEGGLGHWLGALVGALVLGSAFPYALKLLDTLPDINTFLFAVSLICFSGGMLVSLFVPEGPFRRPATTFTINGIKRAFSISAFRSAAFGYFGHMWELYAMWAFIPLLLQFYSDVNNIQVNIAVWSFIVIGVGAIGCYWGGILSSRFGSNGVATAALAVSGCCCLLSPFIWHLPIYLFLLFMIIWGISMAGDSPQFSALVAQHAPAVVRGSAITIVVCIGFAITIMSIQSISYLINYLGMRYVFLVLVPGPVLGVLSMIRKK